MQTLEMVQEKDYGVVLLDLMMPDMDGLQVLESFRKLDSSTGNRS